MSSEKNIDSSFTPTENPLSQTWEQVLGQTQRNVEDYIENEPQESHQFQAFADWADYYIAKKGRDTQTDFDGEERTQSQRESEVGNIRETIRQRINGVSGYSTELSKVKFLVGDLEMAHNDGTSEPFAAVKDLIRIKSRALERYNRQATLNAQTSRRG